MSTSRWRVRLAMAVGILGISSASILIRLVEEHGVGTLTVASWRMLIAALLIGAATWNTRRQMWEAIKRHPVLFAISGTCLAAHFGTWTASLYLIPVARSVLLVEMQPVFVVFATWMILGERPSMRVLACILVALVGAVTMVAGEPGVGQSHWGGDLLAISGAATLGGYVLAGRFLRRDVNILHYAAPLYALTGLLLLLAAHLHGEETIPGDLTPWLFFTALAVIPTIFGHMLFSWCLRHSTAPVVSTAFLGEAPVATLLAVMFLAELPGQFTILGGAIALLGVAGVILSDRTTR